MTISRKEAEKAFLDIIQKLDGKTVPEFLSWVTTSFSLDKEEDKPKYIRDATTSMLAIAAHLRAQIPLKGYLESEKIAFPKAGLDSDCDDRNTIHVDCFLFDDECVEEFVEAGELSRNYCLDCGSKNTKALTFISHSLAPAQLEFMFTKLVPLIKEKEDFEIVDIGSRLGPVIYSAHFYSNGRSHVTGIEMNEDLCKIQREVIDEFGLSNIDVVCSDVRNQEDIIRKANLIVMNNVFNFFMSEAEQIACWNFLRSHVSPGCLLIHNPSIHETIEHLQLDFPIEEWLEEIPTNQLIAEFAGTNEEVFEDCANLHFYRVLPFKEY